MIEPLGHALLNPLSTTHLLVENVILVPVDLNAPISPARLAEGADVFEKGGVLGVIGVG